MVLFDLSLKDTEVYTCVLSASLLLLPFICIKCPGKKIDETYGTSGNFLRVARGVFACPFATCFSSSSLFSSNQFHFLSFLLLHTQLCRSRRSNQRTLHERNRLSGGRDHPGSFPPPLWHQFFFFSFLMIWKGLWKKGGRVNGLLVRRGWQQQKVQVSLIKVVGGSAAAAQQTLELFHRHH